MRPALHANCARGLLRRSVETRCEVVRERDFKLVGTRVLDLSTRGLLLETDQTILTGEDLFVSFKSPTSDRWYDCTATVARVLHGRRRRDQRRAIGVAFDRLHVLDELLLCEELRRAPTTRRHLPLNARLS
jgi:PilZ domain